MTVGIKDDADLPEPLNTPQKQEKRAKLIAAALLGNKARQVRAPDIQGFFSRTRIVTMVGSQKIVIQFRVEPLVVECFERARARLGDVVPSIQYVEDQELEGLGITTYAMSYMPGQVWVRTDDNKVEHRVAIAASLGGILARGFVQSDSFAIVDDFVLPYLSLIRETLRGSPESPTSVLIPHVDRLIEAAPALKALPLWISHYDLNEVNVLIDEQYRVSGIVDWELSTDLPFGMGLHRVCDTIVGRNVQGRVELPPGHDLAEAAFWNEVWNKLPDDARRVIDENLNSFAAAINIGSLFFAFCIDPSIQPPKAQPPSERRLSFLEASLTYRPPQLRGKDGPFEASFMAS